MDANYVLGLTSDKLYDDFIEVILSDDRNADELLTELEKSSRYTDDFIFRIHVQTARQYILLIVRDMDVVLEKGIYLVEKCKVLNLTLLLNINYHLLALCYKFMGHYELAIEYFYKLLLSEQNLVKKRLSSVVNFYLSDIYKAHDDNENAMKHINEAYRTLEESKDWEPRYVLKKFLYSSILFELLYRDYRVEEMREQFEELQSYDVKSHPIIYFTFNIARLFYELALKNYDKAKELLHLVLDLSTQGDHSKLFLLNTYLEIMKKNAVDKEFYREEILLSQTLHDSVFQVLNYYSNKYCYEFYRDTGDGEAAITFLKKSLISLENEMIELKQNRVNSFKLVEKSTFMEENITEEQERNEELRLIAEEALRNKEMAESAFRRLSLVSELGKQLTLSLDLEGIVSTVYERLKTSLPMEGFLITIKNEEKNRLESIVFYEFDQPQPPLFIDQNDESSVFVETFNAKQLIRIDDFYQDRRFETQRARSEDILFRSVLFFPLLVENEVLGVFSLQYSDPSIYKEEDILFLEELLPYLSIALNNALKSQALEKEIAQRKETQNKLEEVNHKLEVLSHLDSLTQISNRRDFESKILGYLRKARQMNETISLFMFDIDNFKLYNDTYGHLEGDEALKSVALIVRRNFEEAGGLSARFGGEEFIGAVLGLSAEEAKALGEKIKGEVYNLGIEHKKSPLGILTISVGIAYTEAKDEIRKSIIMRWADISLYQAKNQGKNRVVLKLINAGEEMPEGLE